MRLEGKVAIITGGARGMGASEAKLFAKEGAKVVIGDLSEVEGRQVEAQIAEAGGEAMFVRMDVTQEEDWRAAVDCAVTRFGKLNVLVNNAGISSSSFPDANSIEGWERIMEINAKGVFLGTRAVIPRMLEAGAGSIVNISSIMGLVGVETATRRTTPPRGPSDCLPKPRRYVTVWKGFESTRSTPASCLLWRHRRRWTSHGGRN